MAPSCHPERSEGTRTVGVQMLRCSIRCAQDKAQHDNDEVYQSAPTADWNPCISPRLALMRAQATRTHLHLAGT
jgi:hypothetical protein